MGRRRRSERLEARLPLPRCGGLGCRISFGLFDGTLDELRAAQERIGRQSQVERIDPHVEQVLLDGSYEVVEELGS